MGRNGHRTAVSLVWRSLPLSRPGAALDCGWAAVRDEEGLLMNIRTCGFLLVSLLFLSSCGFSDSREAAAEVMAQYFAAIEGQDFQSAMAFYADGFFRDSSEQDWEAQLRRYNHQLGDLESYEAVSWNIKKNVGANAGTFVRVVYRTHYSRHPAVEQFILKKAQAADYRIIAHRIQAEAMPRGETQFI